MPELPFCEQASSGGRSRTFTRRLNRPLPYHLATPESVVRTAGLEPAFSCAQGTRDTKLPHALIPRAPSGSRTRTSAMAKRQATATSWALDWLPNCQRPIEHREGIEPSLPHYECGVVPLDHQCLLSVGREALESSSAVLQTAARPSQLPAQVVQEKTRKKPDVAGDTGPCNKAEGKAWVTSVEAVREPYLPIVWQNDGRTGYCTRTFVE